MWLYENHLGGVYLTEERDPQLEETCETCGDSDWCLGKVNTKEEAIALVTEVDEDGSSWVKYTDEHLGEVLAALPSMQD